MSGEKPQEPEPRQPGPRERPVFPRPPDPIDEPPPDIKPVPPPDILPPADAPLPTSLKGEWHARIERALPRALTKDTSPSPD